MYLAPSKGNSFDLKRRLENLPQRNDT